LRAKPRTQASLAVSADGVSWFLLNASPDIHRQIEGFPALWPRERRDTPIAGILLNNGDMDHCLGLLSLRESQPLKLYATAAVKRGFTEGNSLYRTLERFPGQVTWKILELGRTIRLEAPAGADSGLAVTAVPIPGKRPVHSGPGPDDAEDNVGFLIRDAAAEKTLAYFPAVGLPSHPLVEALGQTDAVFFDGTFWSGDEMATTGVGTAKARDMAHWPLGGPGGSLSFLERLGCRRILTHINNTNPILREDSPERMAVLAEGIEIAEDGWEISL
jgi:pyrroloquinoline quinone biosynthesis protein B